MAAFNFLDFKGKTKKKRLHKGSCVAFFVVAVLSKHVQLVVAGV
jgi:hypothetical protein